VAVTRPLIAAATAAVLLLGGCGADGDRSKSAGPTTTAAVSPDFNGADVAFVRALVPHHRQGVEIAKLGAERATRPEARVLAAAIVATQQDEATRLEGWLATWKQPPAPTAAPVELIGTLRTAASADFDKAFLNALIAHQNEAVTLARTEAGAGANRDALAFARQVDESRTAEVEEMRSYLR